MGELFYEKHSEMMPLAVNVVKNLYQTEEEYVERGRRMGVNP